MGRSILAIVVSYLAMFFLAFVGFVLAYLIAGPDFAFKPGIYEASMGWIAIAIGMNLVVAMIGGFICALIAKGGRAPMILAIIVMVLAFVVAFADMNKGKRNAGLVRQGSTPLIEAAQKAHWPEWEPFVFPFTGAIGVLIGAKLKRR
jgi:hypothetical protein